VLLCGLLSSVWCPLGSTQAWVTGGWLWEGTLCVVVVAVGPKRCLRAMYFTAKSGDNLDELLAAARAETAPSKSVFCLAQRVHCFLVGAPGWRSTVVPVPRLHTTTTADVNCGAATMPTRRGGRPAALITRRIHRAMK